MTMASKGGEGALPTLQSAKGATTAMEEQPQIVIFVSLNCYQQCFEVVVGQMPCCASRFMMWGWGFTVARSFFADCALMASFSVV